jgi:hypothetical protein
MPSKKLAGGGSKLLSLLPTSARFMLLLFDPKGGGDYVPPKCWAFSTLHNVTTSLMSVNLTMNFSKEKMKHGNSLLQ